MTSFWKDERLDYKVDQNQGSLTSPYTPNCIALYLLIDKGVYRNASNKRNPRISAHP